MTMNAHVAQSVRRFVVRMTMVVAAQVVLYDGLYADPEVPPPHVDRVRVWQMDGPPYEVTERAAVDAIVEIVRSRRGYGMRIRQPLCFWGVGTLEFYRGGEIRGRVVWQGRMLAFPAREQMVMTGLSPADAAELHRLLGLDYAPEEAAR